MSSSDPGSEVTKLSQDSAQMYCTSLEQIQAAARRIASHIHCTPILTSHSLDNIYSTSLQESRTASSQTDQKDDFKGRLYFKCELFQKTGSFKIRGALNAVLSLSEAAAQRGVLTHSSGNHGQAVALAAQLRQIPAYIVMPRDCPHSKLAAVRDTYKAKVFLCESSPQARSAMANEKVLEFGAEFIHPSNDPRVITGQGTIGLELSAQFQQQFAGPDCKQLDAVIIPLGGGGMISGMAISLKTLHPNIKIFGAEPSSASDAAEAKKAGNSAWSGSSHHSKPVHTCADGLKTLILENNWPAIRDLVDEIITVDEDEIINAMELIYSRMKLAIEPSAGTGLAVVKRITQAAFVCVERYTSLLALKSSFRLRKFRNVGIVLCGGNTNLSPLFSHLRAKFVKP